MLKVSLELLIQITHYNARYTKLQTELPPHITRRRQCIMNQLILPRLNKLIVLSFIQIRIQGKYTPTLYMIAQVAVVPTPANCGCHV